MTLEEAELNKKYNVVVLTIIAMNEKSNKIGVSKKVPEVQGVASSETMLKKGEIMVLFGKTTNIQRLLRE